MIVESQSLLPGKSNQVTNSEAESSFRKESQTPQNTVRVAARTERLAALSLLFQHLRPSVRSRMFRWATSLISTQPHVFNGLLISGKGNDVRAVTWAFMIQGRQINMWKPIFRPDVDSQEMDVFVSDVGQLLNTFEADIAWATVEREDLEAIRAMKNFGLKFMTNLALLSCNINESTVYSCKSDIEFVPYQHSQQSSRLYRILKKSEFGSLDCPQIHGIRRVEDTVQGHLNRDGLIPSDWYLVQSSGEDIGCVLLSRHSARAESELTYLCLVPEARGLGHGTSLVKFAKVRAAASKSTRLLLTCDCSNTPAAELYRREGFLELNQWMYFAKSIRN